MFDLIRDKIGKRKIIIACEDKEEVKLLHKTFNEKGYASLTAHSDMYGADVREMRREWKYSRIPQIFIFSDDVLPELLIYDAELLVHYSLPYKSKSDFIYRFCTLVNNYEKNINTVNPEEKLDVIIFLDDRNHVQLPHIVEFIIRLGGRVPESAMLLSEEIKMKIQLNKKDISLCKDLFKFGKCYSKKKCVKRHAIIKEFDCVLNPIQGVVKFEIKEVHDVVHLSVRLIENYINGKINETFRDLTPKITRELEKYYCNEKNRKSPDTIARMNMYAVDLTKINGSAIFRAKIIDHDGDNRPRADKAEIKLVDVGSVMTVPVSELYELPEKLKKYPSQIIDVYLCNFMPRDFDRQWSKAAIDISRSLFLQELNPNQSWIGNVILSLNDTLILDSVKKFQFLNKIKSNVLDVCVKSKFLSEGIVEINEEHVKNLALLCKSANLEMQYKFENKESVILGLVSEPQWSYFDKDLLTVHFLYAENTSSLFVRLTKYEDLFKKLAQECQEEAKRLVAINTNNVNNYEITAFYKVGAYCLALYGESWRRARIESVASNEYNVYFIDYGVVYTTENILPISEKLLHQLPAQAIECSLSGIVHNVDCCPKVLNKIIAFANGVSDLYVYVHKSNLNPRVTKGKKYGVNLLNSKKTSLNRILIDSKLVKPWRGFNIDFENNIFSSFVIENEEVKPSSMNKFSLKEFTSDKNLITHEGDVENSKCSQQLSELKIEGENEEPCLECFMDQAFPEFENKNSIINMSEEVVGVETSNISEHQLSPKVHRKSESSVPDFVIKTRDNNSLQEVVCFTPQVLWSQTGTEVKLRIMLNNASSYHLSCMPRNILFRCFSNDKLYVVDLKLFGTICGELTDIQVKTFFVQLLLKKLCIIEWPRLHADKTKFQWIKFDVESAFQSESSHIQDLYKQKIMGTKRPVTKRNLELDSQINLLSSDSELSDSETNTSCGSEDTTD